MHKLLIFVLLYLFPIVFSSQSTFNPTLLNELYKVDSLSVSPKGDIIHTLSKWNSVNNSKTQNIQIIRDNQHISTLTYQTGKSDSNPTFSSDGNTVFFLSNRDGHSGIYQVPTNGSENQVSKLVSYEIPISNIKAYTSGSKGFLIFTAEVYLDCSTFKCTSERDQDPKRHYLFTRLYVRHWDFHSIEGKVSHVFQQKIEFSNSKWRVVGDPIDLMNGMNYNCPVPPFGGTEQFSISPNGTLLAITAEKISHDTSWRTDWEILLIDLNSYSVSEPLRVFEDARTQNPLFSPSNRYLTYLTMKRPGYEADKLQLVFYDLIANKHITVLDWDYSISAHRFGEEDHIVFMEADLDGEHVLAIRNLITEEIDIRLGKGSIKSVHHLPKNKGQCVGLSSSFVSPTSIEIFTCSNPFDTIKTFNYNEEFMRNVILSTPTKLHYYRNGLNVNGYYFPPISNSSSIPLVQLIHGGPQGSWNNDWSSRWNPQVWATRGYAVLLVNPRGSTGYKQEYVDAVRGDWGGEPFLDLIHVLNETIKENNIDKNRLCACGASYGGYMINWINGNYHGFKCLVNHDGTFDSSSKYYSTDELFFQEWEFYGTPWTNKSSYDRFTPSKHVTNWNTPTLIIHGAKDYRVPLSEGIMTFTALQRRGIPSKLLYFPSENHWVLNPKNSIQWSHEILNWIDEWIGN